MAGISYVLTNKQNINIFELEGKRRKRFYILNGFLLYPIVDPFGNKNFFNFDSGRNSISVSYTFNLDKQNRRDLG